MLRLPQAAEMARAGKTGDSSARSALRAAKYPDPVLHLLRNPIVAHNWPRVAQAAAFPLNEKAPKSFAGVVHQLAPRLTGSSHIAVIFERRAHRGFKRATPPPERGGLFFRSLIVHRA